MAFEVADTERATAAATDANGTARLCRQGRQPQDRLVDRILLAAAQPLAAAQRLDRLQRQSTHAAALARSAGRAPLDVTAQAGRSARTLLIDLYPGLAEWWRHAEALWNK